MSGIESQGQTKLGFSTLVGSSTILPVSESGIGNISLYYSIDVKPFAQVKAGAGYFGSGDAPHYHFGIIGLKMFYFPWEKRFKA